MQSNFMYKRYYGYLASQMPAVKEKILSQDFWSMALKITLIGSAIMALAMFYTIITNANLYMQAQVQQKSVIINKFYNI